MKGTSIYESEESPSVAPSPGGKKLKRGCCGGGGKKLRHISRGCEGGRSPKNKMSNPGGTPSEPTEQGEVGVLWGSKKKKPK